MALDNINELATDSFMLMIRLVLCAVSKTSLNKDPEKINKNVVEHLEKYLTQMNGKVFQRNTIDADNKNMMQTQIQVT